MLLLSAASRASGTSTADTAPRDYSGLYAATNGIRASLYQSTNASPWVIRTVYGDGTPVTIFLSGKADSLVPSAMETELKFGATPLRIVARGHRVYAVTASGGAGMEVYMDDAGQVHTVTNGKLDRSDSSEAVEARMMISKAADDWATIRSQFVQVREDGMHVLAGQAGGEALNKFTRVGNLAVADLKSFQEIQSAHSASLQEVEDFEARLQKAEKRN